MALSNFLKQIYSYNNDFSKIAIPDRHSKFIMERLSGKEIFFDLLFYEKIYRKKLATTTDVIWP